jgi:hypothetical protein
MMRFNSSDELTNNTPQQPDGLARPTQLYRELADLQADLSKTVAVCHRLKAENDSLQNDKGKVAFIL